MRKLAQRADAARLRAPAPLAQLRQRHAPDSRQHSFHSCCRRLAILDHAPQHLVALQQLAQPAARLLGEQRRVADQQPRARSRAVPRAARAAPARGTPAAPPAARRRAARACGS